MRSLSAFILLLSLVLAAYSIDARKVDPEKYWKTIMNDEPMPKPLIDLLHQDSPSQSTGNKEGLADFRASNMGRFTRHFDTKPNIIIYHHSHDDDQKKAAEDGKSFHGTGKDREQIYPEYKNP